MNTENNPVLTPELRKTAELLSNAVIAKVFPAVADNLAVDAFAELMKQKMATGRAKGRTGWHDSNLCDSELFANMIAEHLHKDNEGNLIDIANLLMMLVFHGGKASQILNFLQLPAKEKGTIKNYEFSLHTHEHNSWVVSIQADFIENFNGQIENQGLFFPFSGKYQSFGDKNLISELCFSTDVLISADIAIEMTLAVANALSKLKSQRTDLLEFKDQQITRMHADIDTADKKYRIAGESEFYDSPEELLARNDLEPIGKTEIQCFAMVEHPSLYAYVKQDGEGNWENVLIDDEGEEDA